MFLLFRNYLPSEKDVDLYLKKKAKKTKNLESPLAKAALCQISLELAQGEKATNVKGLQTDGQTMNGQQAIKKTHMSF